MKKLKSLFDKLKAFIERTGQKIQNKIENNNKGFKLYVVSFFLAPLIIIVSLEIMHLADIQALSVFFLPGQNFIIKLVLSYIFVMACQCILLVFLRKIKWAYLVNSIFFYLLSLVNYVTLALTGDPLLPSDILLVKNLKQIVSFVDVPIRITYIISLVVIILGYMLLNKIEKVNTAKIKTYVKMMFALLFTGFFLVTVYMYCINYNFRHRTMDNMNIEIAAFNPVDNLRKNGLILTFFPRIGDLIVETPERYSKQAITEIKEKYSLTDYIETKDGVNPTIIIIQNEAWWNPEELTNVTFSKDPVPTLHKLEKEGYPVGRFVTPVFTGGTCMPEFEALTGYSTAFLPPSSYPYIQHILSETPSIVETYKNNGYETVAMHPYHKNFYNRSKAYPLLGFDKFLGMDDFDDLEKKGFYASDEYASKKIIEAYENKTKDSLFCFMVTMQNHGAYNVKRYDEYDIFASCDELNELELQGLNDFTQGVYDADKAFNMLIEYFKNVEEPVIIAMYGDHQPLLGTDGSTYMKGGMIEKKENFISSEYPQLYQTPYVLWSNYGVEISLPEHISASKLSLEILKAAKLEKVPGYFGIIDRFYSLYPAYVKNMIYDHTGTFLNNVKEIDKELEQDYEMIQYDLLHGEKYSLKAQ